MVVTPVALQLWFEENLLTKKKRRVYIIAFPVDIELAVMIVGTAFMPSVITFLGNGTDGIYAVRYHILG